MHAELRRGEIYLADLSPTIGSEQGGTRPVLVIQNNTGNRHSVTTIIAAITGKLKPELPTHVRIPRLVDLKDDSIVLLEQIRTIDKARLGNKVGSLTSDQMRLIDIALMASLGVKGIPHDFMIMTLCRTCTQTFRNSGGYLLRRANPCQSTKEKCMVCNVRTGYDFEVIRL